jgi:type VI secretion system protein ImpK
MVDDDDPFKMQDATVIRPRPGAGRRGMGDATLGPRPAVVSMPAPAPLPEAAREGLAIGLNPLLQAASTLLRLAGQARATQAPIDVPDLRRQALDEIRRFEERARSSGVANEIVLAARYVLCATLDEAVLSTPWGSQSEWAQHPLLVSLHREAWGGEKFFDMLDRITNDPAKHIDLMELQYVCLALGFMGKYQLLDRGHDNLGHVRSDLYRAILAQRGKPPADRELAIRWKGLEDRRNPLMRYIPWWVAAVAVLAVLASVFTVYRSRLAALAGPVYIELARTDLQPAPLPPVEPVPSAPSAPTLKQLLGPDERQGVLTVEEKDGRTTITILGTALFASGSATVNPEYHAALQSVARALNQVPGRVVVEGHTDDQPLRSLRYADNYELSRERAVGVVDVLKGTIDSPARLSAQGKGSSEPKYQDRSRNRRVEIIHVRGT